MVPLVAPLVVALRLSDDTAIVPTLPLGPELERVRADIKALRTLAVQTGWYENPEARRATPVEIAVSEADAKPNDCVGHSARTGLRCARTRRAGATLCQTHGSSNAIKKKARRKLDEMLMPALARLQELSQQSDHLPSAVTATKEIVAKTLPSLRREEGGGKAAHQGPVINIGVALGPGQPPAIQVNRVEHVIPAKAEADEDA